MGIRRYACCNPAVLSALAATSLLIAAAVGSVAGRNLPRPPADRPNYQTALRQFRAGETEKAEIAFRELAGEEDGPWAVRACSLNMLGQIARLGGEGPKAREVFGRLASLLEPIVVNESRSADPALVRLFGAACISMAEIAEQAADPKAAITEYERILRASRLISDNPWLNEQSPRIMDKVAQLRLSTRDVDGYLRCAERLRQNYPAYERAVLVELEMECIRLLQGSGDPAVVPQNSYDAPAWAIACARSGDGASMRSRLLDIAASTCPKLPRTCADLVACYHAAWIFESLGDVGEATRRFNQVVSADVGPLEHSFITDRTVETIRGYARVQHAILLAETDRYDEALRALAAVFEPHGETHIAKLTESTRKNIETLKREISNHENRDQ